MQIELIYDAGCPNVNLARARLAGVLSDLGRPSEWQEWKRGAPETPARVGGFASPTILIDGVDVGGRVAKTDAACRLYRAEDGSFDRAPPEAAIRAAVVAAGGGISRRRALGLIAPLLAWPVASASLGPPGLRLLAGRKRDRAHADLPARTIGLRSLGGAFRFDPPGLLIQPGDTVTWLNMGDFHTVTAFHPDNASLVSAPVPLRMPKGAESFHSGMLGLTAGSVFEHRFPIEGVYDYFCQPHYSFGMVGRIVVGGPRGGPAVSADDTLLLDAARRELPSVDAVMGSRGRAWEWTSRINGVLLVRTRHGDAAAAASAVASGSREDDELAAALGNGGARDFATRLDLFVEGVTGAADYETLVQRADEAKHALDMPPNR
jgi:plastocyanin